MKKASINNKIFSFNIIFIALMIMFASFVFFTATHNNILSNHDNVFAETQLVCDDSKNFFESTTSDGETAEGYTLPSNWFGQISEIATSKDQVYSIAFELSNAIPTDYRLQVEITTGIYASYKDTTDGLKDIIIWSEKIIFAPVNSSALFSDVFSIINQSKAFSNLQQLSLNNFDTQNVSNMSYMFAGCKSLTSLDVSGFDTTKTTDMAYMFYLCSSLEALDLTSFDTSNVSNMDNMFLSCSSLETLNITSFATSNLTRINSMFSGCSSLETLDFSSFATSNVTAM